MPLFSLFCSVRYNWLLLISTQILYCTISFFVAASFFIEVKVLLSCRRRLYFTASRERKAPYSSHVHPYTLMYYALDLPLTLTQLMRAFRSVSLLLSIHSSICHPYPSRTPSPLSPFLPLSLPSSHYPFLPSSHPPSLHSPISENCGVNSSLWSKGSSVIRPPFPPSTQDR